MGDCWQVVVQHQAERQLRRLPREALRRVFAAVKALENNPRPPGSEKLRSRVDTYRLRVGDYRVVYDVDTASRSVFVWRVKHRKGPTTTSSRITRSGQ